MKCKLRYMNIVVSACLAVLSEMSYANDVTRDVAIPSLASPYTDGSKSYMLALNDIGAAKEPAGSISTRPRAEFEPPMFSRSNAHKYLGLSTLALVVATALAPKPEGDAHTQAQLDEQKSSTHAKLGRAAATLAAATVMSGLLAHWGDIHV